MEHIRGYDEIKQRCPDDPVPLRKCNMCGEYMYEGDLLYTIDGGICEKCLIDNYEDEVREEERYD